MYARDHNHHRVKYYHEYDKTLPKNINIISIIILQNHFDIF